MNDLIGFFDSGMGGISVLHEAVRLLPNEHFLFYGDNGNAPYGPKSLEEIRRLSAAGIGHLLARDVKAIVIACNTATSAYADIIRRERPDLPIVGMEPALKPAHFARHGGRVLVLATQATLSLEKYRRLKARYGADVTSIVGTGLVELVEAGKAQTQEAADQVYSLLAPYVGQQVDCVVLGCTHYPFLRQHVRALFPDADIFDGRTGTVMRLKDLLERSGRLSDDTPGSVEYETSGTPETMARMRELMGCLED